MPIDQIQISDETRLDQIDLPTRIRNALVTWLILIFGASKTLAPLPFDISVDYSGLREAVLLSAPRASEK